MRIGTGLPNQVRNVRPAVLPAWARQAENAGFTSLATIGRNAYPGISDTVALAAAAAVTSRIELVSGILLGPTWPATLLAKELAGIDGVSNGRLTVGLGVGLRPDDFVAEGYGAAGRGKRFDQDLARFREVWSAWSRAGRDGSPRLVALAYYALGDGEQGRKNVRDYYSDFGDFADLVASAVCDTPQKVREAVASFKGIGADDLIFHASTDDVDGIKRLADIVL
jgi:hypothetical protein